MPHNFHKLNDAVVDFVEEEKNYACKPTETFADVVRKKFWPGLQTAETKEVLDFIMNLNFGNEYGVDPEEASAKYLGQDSYFKGEEHIFPGGYS